MESKVRKCINSVGLDMSIGFLDEVSESKTPLVFDLQAVFRWIIDLSILQLLGERKLLKKSYFLFTENYNNRSKEQTTKMLIEKINENFNRKVSYKGIHHSYQGILMDNVQNLANFIIGKRNEDLQFNVPTIKIERNDSLELQEKIMSMTSIERKRRGINKSTLWYQKKKLAKGNKIRLYGKVLSKIERILYSVGRKVRSDKTFELMAPHRMEEGSYRKLENVQFSLVQSIFI